ncbi:MAG: YqaJ viral recombinase family protein, partial [Desulfobacteraceae bacterium]|nr:YqaJ viral recombinase family protein [Desulfobacteraceae bacterium]
KFKKIVTSTGAPSKSAVGYLHELAAQRITGIRENSYTSAAMKEGTRREEESRLVYAMLKEVEVEQVGFCLSDCGRYGCSPDGLVGKDGLVELKNHGGKVAIEQWITHELPTGDVQQVQGQMLVTGRKWCDYVSYYRGLPTVIIRVKRDEVFLTKLAEQLYKFCNLLDQLCEQIEEGK